MLLTYPCTGFAEEIVGESTIESRFPNDEAKIEGGLLTLTQTSAAPRETLELPMLITTSESLKMRQYDDKNPEQGDAPIFAEQL